MPLKEWSTRDEWDAAYDIGAEPQGRPPGRPEIRLGYTRAVMMPFCEERAVRLAQALGWRAGTRVIVVGCGLGWTVEVLRRNGIVAVGTDISPWVHARKNEADAEEVADAIVRVAQRPVRELVVGNAGRMLAMLHALSPALAERFMARKVESDHFQDRPEKPTAGNLFAPGRGAPTISGGWKPRPRNQLLPAHGHWPRIGAATLLAALAAGAVLAGLTARHAIRGR